MIGRRHLTIVLISLVLMVSHDIYARDFAISEEFTDDPTRNDIEIHWKMLGGGTNWQDDLSSLQSRLRMLEAVKNDESIDAVIVTAQIANLLTQKGQYVEAIPYFEKSMPALDRDFSPFHKTNYYTALHYLFCLENFLAGNKGSNSAYEAKLIMIKERLGKVNIAFNQEMQIVEYLYGPESPETICIYQDFAKFLEAANAFGDARLLLEKSLEIEEKLYGENSPQMADTLMQLIWVSAKSGDKSSVENFQQRYEALPEEDDSSIKKTEFGERPLKQRREKESFAPNRSSIEMKLNRLGKDSPDAIALLRQLAHIDLSSGQILAAKERIEEVLSIEEKTFGSDSPGLNPTLFLLANIHVQMGRPADARPLYERAIHISEEKVGINSKETADSYERMGQFLDRVGDALGAIEIYKKALEIRSKLGNDKVDVISTNDAIALLEEETGDLAAAQKRLEEIVNTTNESNYYPVALNNIALFHIRHEQYQKAKEYLAKAKNIVEESGQLPISAFGLSANLGLAYQGLGKYLEARSFFENALKSARKYYGAAAPETALHLNNLALQYHYKGENKEIALALSNQAVALLDLAYGNYHSDVANALSILAAIQTGQGKHNQARASLIRAENIADKHLVEASPALTWKQKLLILDIYRPYVDDLFSVKNFRKKTFAEAIWRWKGRTSELITAERARVLAVGDPLVAKKYDALAAKRQQLSNLTFESSDPGYYMSHQNVINQLEAEIAALEVELSQQSRALSSILTTNSAKVADVQRQIPEDAALLEYFRFTHKTYNPKQFNYDTEDHYLVLILTKERYRFADLGSAVKIDESVAGFRKVVADVGNLEQVIVVGKQLKALLIDPALNLLAERPRSIIIAPDAVLHTVPFATLPGDRDGSFLIEDYTISYTSSGKDLVRWMHSTGNKNSGLLAIGNPDYKSSVAHQDGKTRDIGSSACMARNWLRNPAPLPGTEIEAKAVVSSYRGSGKTKLFLHKDASEYSVKSSMEQYAFVHVATHGFFLSDACGSASGGNTSRGGGIKLSINPAAVEERTSKRLENPLLLSGLLLAGADTGNPTGGEDGILTALEVTNMDLSRTKLITLSACETGLGELKSGEGVMGLRSAFVIAEANGLVLSLWKVPDIETQLLMNGFYEDLFSKKNIDPARALQKAMITAIKSSDIMRSHPNAWGAFTYTGPVLSSGQKMFNLSDWEPKRADVPFDSEDDWLSYPSFNNQTDNPNIINQEYKGDERQFLIARVCSKGDCDNVKEKKYINTLTDIKAGDRIRFQIYYLNGGSKDETKDGANNVRIGIDLGSNNKSADGYSSISGFITADNTEYRTDISDPKTRLTDKGQPIRSITDDIAIHLGSKNKLISDNGSFYIWTKVKSDKPEIINVSMPIDITYENTNKDSKPVTLHLSPHISGNKMWVEFDKIPAGFGFSGFVYIDAIVK